MQRVLRNIIVVASSLLLLTACVSKGKYNEAIEANDFLARQNLVLLEELDLRDAEIIAMEEEQAEMGVVLEELLIVGQVKMQLLADGLHLELPHDILFTTGSAELSTDGNKLIAALAAEMTDYSYQVVVMGYTDSVPVGGKLAEKYPTNWELAGARAASVVRVMAENGLKPEQLGAVSFGSTRPIASNDTPEGRATNRRIEIRLRPVQIPSSNP